MCFCRCWCLKPAISNESHCSVDMTCWQTIRRWENDSSFSRCCLKVAIPRTCRLDLLNPAESLNVYLVKVCDGDCVLKMAVIWLIRSCWYLIFLFWIRPNVQYMPDRNVCGLLLSRHFCGLEGLPGSVSKTTLTQNIMVISEKIVEL